MSDENKKPEDEERKVAADKASEDGQKQQEDKGVFEDTVDAVSQSKFVKTLTGIFNTAKAITSPVWWPAKKAGFGIYNTVRSDSHWAVKTVGAGLIAGALTGYFGALTYATQYGVVAAGDRYWFGQPYSSGERTGIITKLSLKGKFPCNSMEGELSMPNIGRDGSSTFVFSARRLAGEVKEDLLQAYESGETVSLAYDQSHWPKEWFDSENEGWFVPFFGVSDLECVQKSDYSITEVKFRPGMVLPEAPKLTPGR